MSLTQAKSVYLRPRRWTDIFAAQFSIQRRLPYLLPGRRHRRTTNYGSGRAPRKGNTWVGSGAFLRSASEEVNRWTAVFKDHPEFFLVYALKNDRELKAALRWRYTNKLYDSKTGREYTPQEKEALPEKERWLLTTKPLTSDAIAALMNTAIELHSRQMEELSASRWWVPILAACLGFFGALLGAVVAAVWGMHK